MKTASVPFPKTNASVLIDLLRGLAAVLVVLGHGRNYLFVDFKQVTTPKLWTSAAYLMTKSGHQAVVIFFVLSGYLISGSVLRAASKGTFTWPAYLNSRLVRLWVVLLPGLLLGALWDNLAIAHHLAPSLYHARADNHMGIDVASDLTLRVFLTNLFFLQDVFSPVFGSNGALWSLSSEFWYYMLFPLGLFTIARASTLKTRLICGTLIILIASIGNVFLPLFPVWLAGSLLAVVPVPKCGLVTRIVATMAYIPLFFFCASERIAAGWMDYILTIGTFFFIWILLSATTEARAASFGARSSRELARFSYTLYVVHVPLLVILTALILGEQRWTPSFSTLLQALGVFTLTFLYAYAVASITEFRTDTVRHWLEQRWPILRPVTPSGANTSAEERATNALPEKKDIPTSKIGLYS